MVDVTVVSIILAFNLGLNIGKCSVQHSLELIDLFIFPDRVFLCLSMNAGAFDAGNRGKHAGPGRASGPCANFAALKYGPYKMDPERVIEGIEV